MAVVGPVYARFCDAVGMTVDQCVSNWLQSKQMDERNVSQGNLIV